MSNEENDDHNNFNDNHNHNVNTYNILKEHIFNIILSFIVPVESNSAFMISVKNERILRKPDFDNDYTIKIHVCDETSNSKKVFECSQKLLFSEMHYFNEAIKNQNLRNVSISVHCDISIFEWLLDWAQCEFFAKTDHDYPILTSDNIVQILVSASFLKMGHLIETSLIFFHSNINEILRKSTSLNCLNDEILESLAQTFTNIQLETISDKKDKVLSKLYCRFIRDLFENEAEPIRGHWYSFLDASTYCKNCKKFLLNNTRIQCTFERAKVLKNGQIRAKIHEIDPGFEIEEFINQIKLEMKNWKSTYWRLWGYFHWLYCSSCKQFFPVYQLNWCNYHPIAKELNKLKEYFYPCCKNKSYTNSDIDKLSGCKYRSHVIMLRKVTDESIYNTLIQLKGIIIENPPNFNENDNSPSDCFSSASSLTFISDHSNESNKEVYTAKKTGKLASNDFETFYDTEKKMQKLRLSPDKSWNDSDSDNEELSIDEDSEGKYLWDPLLPARINLELQREYEEELFQKLGDSIIQKLSSKHRIKKDSHPGGIYRQVYMNWYDKNLPHITKTKTKNTLNK